jgi:transposase
MPWDSNAVISQRYAFVQLVDHLGYPIAKAARDFGISRRVGYKWLKRHRENVADPLSDRSRRPHHSPNKLADPDDPAARDALFSVLHSPPSSHDINRTTWRYSDLLRVLKLRGVAMSSTTLTQIIRASGYQWRKARKVLTSRDPEYRQKMDRIHDILGTLGHNDCFFSIDEYGPFSVKILGGRKLVAPGEDHVVPQWQTSKGTLIVTAALELSSNQVTHFYSDTKNTEEMLRLLAMLLLQYRSCDNIYLSWDAASWHIAKRLQERVEEINRTGAPPHVHLAPLPSGAQFANVIESIFIGMARAVIHNSDYSDIDVAKAAISRHFDERNAFFKANPKRAGKKIWGKELVTPSFNESQNCKDSRYR